MVDPNTPLSDDEVRDILSRAADRQEQAERAQPLATRSHTLAEVEAVAEDVGIDREHLRAAAHEILSRRDTPAPPTRLGLPLELTGRRAFPASITDAQWERMVGVLRTEFKRNGISTHFGEAREWVSSNASGDSMPIQVRVESSPAGTAITARQETRSLLLTPAVLGGSFSAMAIVLGVLFAVGDFQPGVSWISVMLGA